MLFSNSTKQISTKNISGLKNDLQIDNFHKSLKNLSLYAKSSKKLDALNEFGFKNNYIPKTDAQKEYKKSLYNPDINLLFCLGPAGTGKTLFACQHAIESLNKGTTGKIIITRPTIAIEEDMGFLPGDIREKMHPWTIPIFDIFQEYYTKKDINNLVNDNIIEIAPLGFMQGRTFKNSIIIADEMQNSTPNQMFMLLTRLGDKSKMIITGDLMQSINDKNGLNDIIKKLNIKYQKNDELISNGINIVKLSSIDVQRHPIVAKITELYKQ
jgi:phosphate starvation-inducible PhoH-like protein